MYGDACLGDIDDDCIVGCVAKTVSTENEHLKFFNTVNPSDKDLKISEVGWGDLKESKSFPQNSVIVVQNIALRHDLGVVGNKRCPSLFLWSRQNWWRVLCWRRCRRKLSIEASKCRKVGLIYVFGKSWNMVSHSVTLMSNYLLNSVTTFWYPLLGHPCHPGPFWAWCGAFCHFIGTSTSSERRYPIRHSRSITVLATQPLPRVRSDRIA